MTVDRVVQQKVGIVGFGYVGTMLGVFLADHGVRSYGIDVDQDMIDAVAQGTTRINEPDAATVLVRSIESGMLVPTTDYSVLDLVKYVLITVGTPLSEGYKPDFGALKTAAHMVGKYLKQGQTVILKSTVVPGATSDIVRPILEQESGLVAGEDFLLAYCPERLAEGANIHDFTGSALDDFANAPVVVGGIDAKSTESARDLWESVGLEVSPVASPTAAEMVKLADNWWIDVNIAIANEVGLLCENLNVDSLEVIRAANTLKKGSGNVNILYPGAGVGGSCLTKDPYFIIELGKKFDLMMRTAAASRAANDYMPTHMFNLISKQLASVGKKISESRIAVLGLAFKNNTNDIRHTPALPLLSALADAKASITICDPWVHPEDVRALADSFTASICQDPEEAFEKADAVALITPQPEFASMDFNAAARRASDFCVIVDGRRSLDPERIRDAGFRYCAVGLGNV